MAKASNNPFPSVLVVEGATPASPAAGDQRLFVDSADHKLKRVNSSGTVTTVEGGASAIVSHAKATRSAALSLAGSNTWNYIAWDAEEFDTDSYHDTVTNNPRMTVPATGIYEVGYSVVSSGSTTTAGRFLGYLLKNGDISTGTKITGGANEFDSGSGTVYPNVGAVTLVSLTAADWLQVVVFNAYTASLAVDTATSAFWIRRLS